MRKIELFIETVLFQSRWILAPFYLGLALSLLLLLYHFVIQLAEFVIKIPFAKEADVILGVLGLIDLTFTGNLIVIVIFSGYENFVSRIEAGKRDRPGLDDQGRFRRIETEAGDLDRRHLGHCRA
jgi:uncharacterized protein (TIGR00645 family)